MNMIYIAILRKEENKKKGGKIKMDTYEESRKENIIFYGGQVHR